MFAIVIDEQGFKIEFVHIFEDGTIDSYELKDGESIIEECWQVANSMNKPQWNGTEWIDTDPLPPVEPPVIPPDKNTILEQELKDAHLYITELELQLLEVDMRLSALENNKTP